MSFFTTDVVIFCLFIFVQILLDEIQNHVKQQGLKAIAQLRPEYVRSFL